ncbi:sugar transferase [Microbacterium sp. 18062]|uniref:sugar transferase n=1 Tax=Microbacterium sp. 18062 TaxID=2681410 RepID=UPI001358F669|nr:sugar transferase [Microbacterium sp. 18062]
MTTLSVEQPPLAVTAPAPRPTPELERRQRHDARHRRRVAMGDLCAIAAATGAAAILRSTVAPPDTHAGPGTAMAVPLAVALVWMVLLAALRTRDPGLVFAGKAEYARVAHATALAFTVLSVCFVALPLQGVRTQLIGALPAGLGALLLNRWIQRQRVARRRRLGLFASRTLIVGSRNDVEHVARALQHGGRLGHNVVGTTLDGDTATELTVGPMTYPVWGPAVRTAQAARELGADTVVVAGALEDPDLIRRLSWELEGTAAELVLATRLTDVAAGRISFHRAEGLALVAVSIPTFDGTRHRLKRVLDVVISGLALVPIALVTPLIAALILLDSRGGVFFRQRRVGRDGREFDIVKFRTMRAGAETERAALAMSNEASGALFKIRRDPRVTRVGGFLRRYSIDELPQFWNVLRGDMSVVGPRPPLPSEVRDYDGVASRRLYIKPGITGPWQVGGRSDLTWEQSVRLDLHYVENWSVLSDLGIICRTARAVVSAKGAY